MIDESVKAGRRTVSRYRVAPVQWTLHALRELAPVSETCDTPERVAAYWSESVVTDERFTPEVETFVVIMVNTRRRIIGHVVASTGTLDTLLVHPRSVFRPAIVANAAAVILAHNHPSGDPTPSEADIRVTRDLMRAGQLLKIDVLDHLVMGTPQNGGRGWVSLREMGCFQI